MRNASLLSMLLIVAGCDSPPTTDAGLDTAMAVDAPSLNDTPESDVPSVDAPSTADVPSTEDAPVAFALTSTAYEEGGAIPQDQSCNAANESPPLAWTGAPAGTMSFALTLVDESNGLTHSAFYDIPADTTSLPGALPNVPEPTTPAGMKQVRGYDGSTYGYLGPCPGSAHTYTWTLYALDVAALPGVTTMSSRSAVETAIDPHVIGTATLTGIYTP